MNIRRERVSAAPAQACSPQRSSRVDRDSLAVGGQRQRNFQSSRKPTSHYRTRPESWHCRLPDTCHDRFQLPLRTTKVVWMQPGASSRFDSYRCHGGRQESFRAGADRYGQQEGDDCNGGERTTLTKRRLLHHLLRWLVPQLLLLLSFEFFRPRFSSVGNSSGRYTSMQCPRAAKR
jgi:hypothetical protein